jgi:uncharacterized membrane protein YedE/YeeE
MNSDVWLGLLSGIAFGFVIQRAGATNANKMARAHLMIETDIPRFMLMAVALSVIGLLGLQVSGVGRTLIIPTSLVATGIAGALFGIGWGLCGYCPGTMWAAAGEGRMDAIFALLGGLAGTAVFAQLHEALIPLLYAPTNVGQITLADWIGSKPLAVAVLSVGFAVCIWIMGAIRTRNKYAALQ